MKEYIEYILLENLIVNYLLIQQLNYFIKKNPKKINNMISIAILSIYTTLTYIFKNSSVNNLVIKLLTVNISIYILYFPKTVFEYFKQIIYFYSIYFSYIGIILGTTLILGINIEKIYVRCTMYVFCYTILHLINNFMWKMWKTNIKEKELTYKININNYEILSFVDTGHTVKDYINNLDVIFIDNSLYHVFYNLGILNYKVKLNFTTVENECLNIGYIIKDVKFIKEKDVYNIDKIVIVFTKRELKNDLNYKGIISYDTYLDKLKGVTLC